MEAQARWEAIRAHGVTHMCGAPIVYSMLINAPAELRAGIDHRIAGQVAGAAPPAAIIEGAEQVGIDLTHVYGLTEIYGPPSVCAKQPEWAALPLDRRAERNGRQGVRVPMQEAMTVLRSRRRWRRCRGRRDDGRDHVPRQHHDEGLSEEPRRPPTRRSPAAGSTPATSR